LGVSNVIIASVDKPSAVKLMKPYSQKTKNPPARLYLMKRLKGTLKHKLTMEYASDM